MVWVSAITDPPNFGRKNVGAMLIYGSLILSKSLTPRTHPYLTIYLHTPSYKEDVLRTFCGSGQ